MSDLAQASPVAQRFATPDSRGALVARLAPWIVAALVLVAAPHVLTSGTALTMMSLMGVMIVFSLSYNMLLGQTGMLSFGTLSITGSAPSSPFMR